MGFKQFRPVEPAKPVTRVPKGPNKTEARYGLVLEARKRIGEISGYEFGAVTLKLADDVRYTPDFLVVLPDLSGSNMSGPRIELHEVKGFMREDARIKLRVAAKQFPFFTFRLCRIIQGSWSIEEVTG